MNVNVLIVNFGQGEAVAKALAALSYATTMVIPDAFKTAHLSKFTHIILSDSDSSLSECIYMLSEDDVYRIAQSGKRILAIGYGFHLLVYYLSCKFSGVRRIPAAHREEVYIPNKLGLTNPYVKFSYNHADYVSTLNEKWDIIDYIPLKFKNETMLAVNIGRMKRETGLDIMGVQFNAEAREKTYSFFRAWIEWIPK